MCVNVSRLRASELVWKATKRLELLLNESFSPAPVNWTCRPTGSEFSPILKGSGLCKTQYNEGYILPKPKRNDRKIGGYLYRINLKQNWQSFSRNTVPRPLCTCLSTAILLLSCCFIINPLNWTKTGKNFRPSRTGQEIVANKFTLSHLAEFCK